MEISPEKPNKGSKVKVVIANMGEELHQCQECGELFKYEKYLRTHLSYKHNNERKFNCDACGRSFKTAKDVYYHYQTHLASSDKRFKCRFCDYGIGKACYMKIHMLKLHDTDKIYYCPPPCDMAWAYREEIQQHNLDQHRDKPANHYGFKKEVGNITGLLHAKTRSGMELSCDICKLGFRFKDKLENHMLKHSKENRVRRFVCDICGAAFMREDHLNSHTAMKHSDDRPFLCSKCSYSCKTKTQLVVHERTHFDMVEAPLQCKFCDHKVYDNTMMRAHLKKFHEIEAGHDCKECSTSFKYFVDLKKHEKAFHPKPRTRKPRKKRKISLVKLNKAKMDKKLVKQEKAKREIVTRSIFLKTEIKDEPTEGSFEIDENGMEVCMLKENHFHDTFLNETLIQCPYKNCKAKLPTEELLEEHQIKIHQDHTVIFTCDICKLTFRLKRKLTIHMERHKDEGKRENWCDSCGAIFKEEYELKTHILYKHTKARPYLCSTCSCSTRTRKELRCHERMHEPPLNEFPYKCRFCDQTLKRSSLLRSHLMNHHQVEEVYECDTCHETFKYLRDMKEHVAREHTAKFEILEIEEVKQEDENEEESEKEDKDDYFGEEEVEEDRPFACPQCGDRFRTARNMKCHMTLKHDHSRAFKCDQCDFSAAVKIKLMAHQKTHMDVTFEHSCRFAPCDFKHLSASVLRKHVAKFHNTDEVYNCEDCDIGFKYFNDLAAHKREKHSGVANPALDLAIRVLKAERVGNSNYQDGVTDDFADVMDQVIFEEFVEEPEEKVYSNNLGFVAVEHDYNDHFENDIDEEYPEPTNRPFGSCKKVTKVPRNLMMQSDVIYKCARCQSSFLSIKEYKDHQNFDHDQFDDTLDQKFICDMCGSGFKKKHVLAHHQIQVHTIGFPYKCNFEGCTRGFKVKNNMTEHQKTHVRPFKCRICEKMISTSKLLRAHMHSKHQSKDVYHCDQCDLGFEFHNDYNKHIKSGHDFKTDENPERREYPCLECEKIYYHNEALWRHQQRVHRVDPQICQVCGKGAKNKATMSAHMKSHVPKDPNKPKVLYSCDQCEKIFRDRQCWQAHYRTHTMELPYSCKVCGILKKTARELLNHNRREHLAEHKCKHCLEVYSTRADLMIHRKSHHQKLSRDYNCDVCGKDYHSSVAMNNHRNSAHTGVQYHCDTCQGIFKTKKTLAAHKKIHIDNTKRFECEYCQKLFRLKKTMTRHRERHIKQRNDPALYVMNT